MPGISGTSLLLPDIHEQNVTFVICASESKAPKLCILKELLIKTLFSLASKPTYFMFNIVNCASKVLKWQEHLVKCSLISIVEAAAWIRALPCRSGVSAFSAVAAALEDPTCQAAYLFTSGLPECTAEEICNHLRDAGEARPLHIVYLVGNEEENGNTSQETLEKVAKASGGSFQVTRLSFDRTSDEDNPGCVMGINCCDCISKQQCSTLLTRDRTKTHFPLGVWNSDSPNTFLRSFGKEDLADCSPKIQEFQRGIRVLARKETDGYYYLSHIVQGVKGSRDRVLIVFERSQRTSKGKAQLHMQETPLYDIIHYEDARWQPLDPGDRVLAPCDKKGERYGPGIILQVEEAGLSHSVFKNSKVLVNFWNGQTKKVSADVAVRIPPASSDRIILELQMPLSARQMLVEQSPGYPSVVPPGYRASGPCRQNHLSQIDWTRTPKAQCVGSHCTTPFCHFSLPAWEPIRSPVCTIKSDDALIPGTSLTKEELSRKIEEQLAKGRLSVTTNSENEKEESRKQKKDENLADLKSCEGIESNMTKPNKDPQRERALEDPREGAGTMIDVAVNTDKCTTWQKQKGFSQPNMNDSLAQYSQRSPSWKTYAAGTSQLQAMFDHVNQSLKKDRSAIESVLHIRRSFSVPSMQRLAVKEAPQGGSREMDVNTARIEFKHQKWEQRWHMEAQKQQEEHLRKELRLDKKRQRSLQRSLQGLQKQEEESDRAGQRMEQLQIARAEKKRQESCLQDKERNKESQRAEFLKTQREQREKLLTEHNQRLDNHEKRRLELLRTKVQSMQKNSEVAVQEQEAQKREKAVAKRQMLQKRDQVSQQVEKESQKHRDLQQYLKEQSLLTLCASLLP
ncbi:uncharacterized protein [Tiliqua scincoides]